MKKFRFQLEPLLKLRRNQRDLCRQALARVLYHDNRLVEARRETEADRLSQIDELRSLEEGGQGVNIDASVSRRSYAGQLSGDLGEIDARRAALAKQIDVCRLSLVRADQAVQALEKLAERQHADFIFNEERKEALELEQTWLAIGAARQATEPLAP
ncbi:MAG: flagellar FliJ family protein [Planctomycetia bacterium]|nr:flagellar FliJ family protein [Planctomycetia bacterium]